MTWVDDRSGIDMQHKDGVAWHEHRRPSRWHRCWAQTRGVHDLRLVERCPCGAIRIDNGPWMEKNS